MARHLAAIMFTDLVGFTKLGQRDEESALRLRREHQGLLRPLFGPHGGREVKSLGDGFLVEFASAVESVRCAAEIQRVLAARNAAGAPGGPIVLRIGIHVGDVVDEAGDVVGDAVNLASRIEPLAEPGGICVSATVFEQVRNKLPLTFEGLGPRRLKNIDDPVLVYRVRSPTPADASAPAPTEATAAPRLAVLPLANLSAEAADGFFADGLTDELITRTAQIPGLRVIARTSVQRYKGSPKSIREVGQELDVAFALEGSIRKAGPRVRISVQLVDTRSEGHLWSARYDRPLDDLFAIQDDIAGRVAEAIAAHFSSPAGPAHVPPSRLPPDTAVLEAYSLYLHGRQLLGEKASHEGIRSALSLFESAVALDPRFARARVGIAEASLWLASEAVVPYHEAERRAYVELRRAIEINEAVAEAHSVLAALYVGTDQFREAEREARRATELNPSLADPYRWLAQVEASDGRIDEAVRLLGIARALDPEDINVLAFLGHAFAYAGREAEALALWEETLPRIRFRVNANLTEHYLGKGDLLRAATTVAELERLRPESSWTVMFRGILAARQGDRDGAARAVDRLDRRAREGEMTVFQAGFIRFALGETDAFFAAMEEALRHHALPALELTYSPLFIEARKDPRFQDLLRRQRALTRAPRPELLAAVPGTEAAGTGSPSAWRR
jgi:adenylate cyclase